MNTLEDVLRQEYEDAGMPVELAILRAHEDQLAFNKTMPNLLPPYDDVLKFAQAVLDFDLTVAQRLVLKRFYHLPLDPEEDAVFRGMSRVRTLARPDQHTNDLTLSLGRRAGGTTIVDLVAAYEILRILDGRGVKIGVVKYRTMRSFTKHHVDDILGLLRRVKTFRDRPTHQGPHEIVSNDGYALLTWLPRDPSMHDQVCVFRNGSTPSYLTVVSQNSEGWKHYLQDFKTGAAMSFDTVQMQPSTKDEIESINTCGEDFLAFQVRG